MRHYETMFIIKPTLVEEEIRTKIDFFKDVITKNGGIIQTCLDMGMRDLAYQIKKHSRGYYFVIYFMAKPEFTFELGRLYRINEDILRFIVIKRKPEIWQSLVNRADKKEKPKSLKKDDDSSRDRSDRNDRRHDYNRQEYSQQDYNHQYNQNQQYDRQYDQRQYDQMERQNGSARETTSND